MKYKKVDYRYTLVEAFEIQTPIKPEKEIRLFDFAVLSTDGHLAIFPGYSWDGASGKLTVNTVNVLKGSLVHDLFYQLMRLGLLPLSCRDSVDLFFKEILIASGVSRFRAWYFYQAVKMFGEKYAIKQDTEILEC